MDKPIILKQGEYTQADLDALRNNHKIWQVNDLLEQQLHEFFAIAHPELDLAPDHAEQSAKFVSDRLGESPELQGNWVYLPWSGKLLHILTEGDFQKVRTNRNRNLVTEKEQAVIADFRVGILGLSIGNSLALTLSHGGFNNFKLTDFDTLATSNLNRVRAPLSDVGNAKIALTSQQIYELNPYADLICFPEGVKEDGIDSFLGKPSPGLILEVIDDFVMKIRIRQAARKLGIPVIMPTSLGDSVLIDVERYDLDPNLPLFNGLIGSTPEDILSAPVSEEDKQRYAIAIVGMENVPVRALESVREIHKTLVGRPQLMSTVTVASGIAGFLARKVALEEPLASGRYKVVFEDFISPVK